MTAHTQGGIDDIDPFDVLHDGDMALGGCSYARPVSPQLIER